MKILAWLLVSACFAGSSGCAQKSELPPDRPRLTANVRFQDVALHSRALGRNILYRVMLPSNIPPSRKLPALYLLHGNGGNYRDWSNYSNVAQFADKGLILVMPEGEGSYYVNAAQRPADRFEDYITRDLIADVETKFPVAPRREDRAIAGVSMGGFGAIILSLKHPDLFVFTGALSPALDVPSRPFSIKRIGQYHEHRTIFGAWGSSTRRASDPYVIIRSSDPATVPYLFLSCGEQEGLLAVNKRFVGMLQKKQVGYEFHLGPGGHDWNQWNRRLPDLFESLATHMNLPPH